MFASACFIGIVIPRTEAGKYIFKRKCLISDHSEIPRPCPQLGGCFCPSGVCSEINCSHRYGTVDSNGPCCEAHNCCVRTRTVCRRKKICRGGRIGNRQTRQCHYERICSDVCDQYKAQQCYITWKICRKQVIEFQLSFDGESIVEKRIIDCQTSSSCLSREKSKYPLGNYVTCWYDQENKKLSLLSLDHHKEYIIVGWVGVGIGLFFTMVSSVIILISLRCGRNNEGHTQLVE